MTSPVLWVLICVQLALGLFDADKSVVVSLWPR